MFHDSFHAIVLFSQDYKETDGIVKLFTLEYGKQMFFVRNLNKKQHPLKAALYPFSRAEFVGKINRNGLSFLTEAREVKLLRSLQDDLEIQAYCSFMTALADAVIDDRIVQKDIYQLLFSVIEAIDKGLDIHVLSLMYEWQLLPFFGVDLNLDHCAVTGLLKGPFDFSFKYGGLLAESEWHKDIFRLQADPNAIFLLQKMKRMSFQQVASIHLQDSMKAELRRITDAIYDEYVGIKLKSKKFLDDMASWYYEK